MAFIIYGTNYHLGRSYEMDNYCCPYCDHYDSTELFLVSEYFHIFYILYMPTGKTGSTLCSNCKKVVQQVNFSPALVPIFRKHQQDYRHPSKMYSGFIILPGFIIIAFMIHLLYTMLS